MRKKQKPDLLGAGPCGKDRKNRGWFFLSSLRGPVNPSGLYFRIRPLAGLMLAGGWADRLTLWLPLADITYRMLRAVVEGRI